MQCKSKTDKASAKTTEPGVGVGGLMAVAQENTAPVAKPAVQSKRYWRSLDELAQTPEFEKYLHREFPEGASEILEATRRGFLKLMGASVALAGLAGCLRWPEEQIAPYAHRPANRMPGVPVTYATAFEVAGGGGIAQGVLVESYDGRPTKIEGNPSHPLNKGATDVFAQGSVLEVYDPDRSRGVSVRVVGDPDSQAGPTRTWEDFEDFTKRVIAADGSGLVILSEASASPSVAEMRKRLLEKRPKTQWVEYEAVSQDNVREGLKLAFGQPLRPVLELAKAKVVVTLDADIFGAGDPLNIKYARDFMAGRRLTAQKPGTDAVMNRLYSAESLFTLTGSQADHHRAVSANKILVLANQIAVALGVSQGVSNMSGGDAGVDKAFVEALIADLRSNIGTSVVVAGPRQPARVHALVAQINNVLGNTGKTVTYYADLQPERPHHVAAMRDLVEHIADVKTLVILGGNPVYDAPADLDFRGALSKVKNSVHLSLYDDETSKCCQWHLSRTHFLEAWGDARTFDGTVSIVQPQIEPLFDGKSLLEVLAILAGEKAPTDGGNEIVKRTFKNLLGAAYTDWMWKRALVEGVVAGTAQAPWAGEKLASGIAAKVAALAPVTSTQPASGNGLELVLFADGKTLGGRYANIGWLQELPDPMTRVTWDNAALISPKTAAKLGITDYEIIQIPVKHISPYHRVVEATVYVMPGVAEDTVCLALGYGRRFGGTIADEVGTDAYPLLSTEQALGYAGLITITKTGETNKLATVQQHHMIDKVGKEAIQERVPDLIRERTLEEFKKDPNLGMKKILALSIFDEHKFDGRVDGKDKDPSAAGIPDHDMHKWGMAIDLTSCTGCSACVVACQAENNIPIVGKDQVLHGREMHWLRIDRYFMGEPEAIGHGGGGAVHQPLLCQHCENAPCEEVCPVAATTHSQEGINMMTYNRCIGTRYCANNCPYKVRRFNFFDFNRGNLKDQYTPNLLRGPLAELLKMQKNPEVTVRTRGVMEKCTYCVQRIETTRIKAKREGDREIPDGEIQTACQQSCPTGAIVFGDLNQDGLNGRSKSQVTRLHELARTYGLLDAELNTRPRTQYITKIRNPQSGVDTGIHEG